MTKVEGERRFAAPPQRVFDLLTDPEVIASAIPAVRGHSVIDPDHWQAKVKPPVPFAPGVTIRFEVLERRPPAHARLHAHGGGADVMSTFDLAPDGEGTSMHWQTESSSSASWRDSPGTVSTRWPSVRRLARSTPSSVGSS